jgi:hypothetical protein
MPKKKIEKAPVHAQQFQESDFSSSRRHTLEIVPVGWSASYAFLVA